MAKLHGDFDRVENGVYTGVWEGYDVEFVVGSTLIRGNTEGIASRGQTPCIVAVHDDEAQVTVVPATHELGDSAVPERPIEHDLFGRYISTERRTEIFEEAFRNYADRMMHALCPITEQEWQRVISNCAYEMVWRRVGELFPDEDIEGLMATKVRNIVAELIEPQVVQVFQSEIADHVYELIRQHLFKRPEVGDE